MPRHIPGDPAALRAGAAQLRRSAETARGAAHQVQASRDTAAGGWKGEAAGAFDRSAAGAQERIRILERLGEAAAPLETYAAELEAAQQVWDANLYNAVHAYGTSDYEPAVQALSAAQNSARAANERCAAEIDRIAGLVRDGYAAEQEARTRASLAIGNAVSAAGKNAEMAGKFAEEHFDPAAKAAADAEKARWSRLGNGLSVVGPAVGQVLSDADNPQYSTAERAGRAAAQGATVGGASILGGAAASAAAGAALGSVVPGAGTVVGGVVGLAAGAIGGYFAAGAMDSVNDDIVDWAGDATDALFSW